MGLGAIAALYIFGGLGNVRHGYEWNNSWFIEYLGKYNNKYPAWLPKQFMWAYSYIVSPLSNLNLNVLKDYSEYNIWGYLVTFLPDFISKRLFPAFYHVEPVLMVSYFTATAAFGKAFLWGGYAGIFVFYLFVVLGQLILLNVINIKVQYKMPLIGVMNGIVAFMFFTHTISYSAISFIAVYPLLSLAHFERVKFIKKRPYITIRRRKCFIENAYKTDSK